MLFWDVRAAHVVHVESERSALNAQSASNAQSADGDSGDRREPLHQLGRHAENDLLSSCSIFRDWNDSNDQLG